MTLDDLVEAIWQAYYHHKLDELIVADVAGNLDGNDHPSLRLAAEGILSYLKTDLNESVYGEDI